MGEANRRRDLGLTREIEVRLEDVCDLVRFLTELTQKTDKDGNPVGQPRAKLTAGRLDRLALKRALDALGAMDIYNMARKPGGLPVKELEKLPKRQRRTLTVEQIDLLLARLEGERDMSSSLNLVQLEQDLEDAKHGNYDLPPAATTDVPAPE